MSQNPTQKSPGTLKKKIWEIAKYLLSSSIGTLVDYVIFVILLQASPLGRTASFTIGRAAGAITNFCINKLFVFRKGNTSTSTLVSEIVKYTILWVIMYFGALGLLHLYADTLHIHALIAKPMADVTMYIFGFMAQKFVVFNDFHKEKHDQEE